MENKRRFTFVDILLLTLAILPLIAGIVLQVLTKDPTGDITITGARVFFTVKMPLQDWPITESQVNSWLVMLTIFFLCLFITHGLKAKPDKKRQLAAEWIVEKCTALVKTNMGEYFLGFAPFIAAVLALSVFSSLLSLLGLFAPTGDLNVVGGWALAVFFLITHYKMKCGPLYYLKGFTESIVVLTPFNIISEIATPVSMTFRHYGNVLSGTAISVLVAAALQGLSNLVLGWLPGVLGEIPFLQIGLPAVLSVYFDVFSSCIQAFIFAMLTMLYVAGAFPMEDYFARRKRREEKKKLKSEV